MEKFHQVFEHNFYLTEEFGQFCAGISSLPLNQKPIASRSVFTLKNKNISISDYSQEFQKELRRQKLAFSAVTEEDNNQAASPSPMEYALFYKTTYEQAAKNYATSFFHGLREGRKFPHEVRIVRQPDDALIKKIHSIYTLQMRRRNSFIQPLSFFQKFLHSPSALLFLIEARGQIMAYFCCFQYQDNIYNSIGGGDPRYFKQKSSNKLYDELIRYACANHLNIHMGIGEHNSGYQKFKHNTGAVNYRLEQYPNEDWLLKLSFFLVRFKIMGWILALLSRFFPEQISYIIMPFT